MSLSNAVRATAIEMAKQMYEDDFVRKITKGSRADVDERINLESLVERVECEIRLAVEEFEYSIADEEDEP